MIEPRETAPQELRLAVVIPTLNAAASLPKTAEALNGSDSGMSVSVFVCDGGSSDATRNIVRDQQFRLVEASTGRGRQLGAGAEAALAECEPDLLLFLHADSMLQRGWCDAVRSFMARSDQAEKAGYFRLTFDDPKPAARRLERIVAWRCRWLGLPYGDQGLLICPALYRRTGGYKSIPLMEDVDIVCRVGRAKMVALNAAVETSAARYRKTGYITRCLRNLFCLTLFFLGVPPRIIVRFYG